jgi:hypothetical protein
MTVLFEAQCPFQRPPSKHEFTPHKSISAKVERRERGVDAQCLCQRPPPAPPQAIHADVERRNRGVEAQCLCQRPPSAISQAAAVEAQHNHLAPRAQALQLVLKPSAVGELNSAPLLHNRICLFYGSAHRLRRLAQRNGPARGQHLVTDQRSASGSCCAAI